MACRDVWNTWPSGLRSPQNPPASPSGFVVTGGPRAMYFTHHGKPWLKPITTTRSGKHRRKHWSLALFTRLIGIRYVTGGFPSQNPINVKKFTCHDVMRALMCKWALQWRNNGLDSVSNHQPTIVYSTVYSGSNQRKHQSSSSLAFVRGIHRWPVNSPHKWPVTRKMFPFDDVIMEWPLLSAAQWWWSVRRIDGLISVPWLL